MRKFLQAGLIMLLGLTILIYLLNASFLAPRAEAGRYFIAHRSTHQTYPAENIGRDDCTATLISAPIHDYIGNTLPAIGAAIAAGAEIVEIDIHPTTDGNFAVFHDWTLDCRTNGTGVTRQQTMDYIRSLDPGYGYTSDDGQTYPLRGGATRIPSLSEVLKAFPDQRFLIDFKSNDPTEAERLSNYLSVRGLDDASRLLVYGGHRPVQAFIELHPESRGFDRQRLKRCGLRYLAIGWSGRVPGICENTVLLLPKNYARLLWGWPRRLETRMARANTLVWVIGDWDGKRSYTTGVDTPEALGDIPDSFNGGVWTNRIELINRETPTP